MQKKYINRFHSFCKSLDGLLLAKECFRRITEEYSCIFEKFREKALYYMKEMQKEDEIAENN